MKKIPAWCERERSKQFHWRCFRVSVGEKALLRNVNEYFCKSWDVVDFQWIFLTLCFRVWQKCVIILWNGRKILFCLGETRGTAVNMAFLTQTLWNYSSNTAGSPTVQPQHTPSAALEPNVEKTKSLNIKKHSTTCVASSSQVKPNTKVWVSSMILGYKLKMS